MNGTNLNNGDGESNNRINFPFSQHIHTIPVNLTMPQISLELDDLSIRRIDQIALNDYPHLVRHIFELLSDKATLRFIPEKEVIDLKSARQWLLTSLMNSQCGRNQTHLIHSLTSGDLLGIIDIIPPNVAREYYQLKNYPFFIEFYLKSTVFGRSIMSDLLPKLVDKLQDRGVQPLAAVVNRKNIPARKVLSRSGFAFEHSFDQLQDLYSLSV
ncbi:GNAT family N-acetyltransferase [Mucilaginibacter achroorhodeus]|uniref:GNAT family N-acetyltransferase n=1 Tax=Mucilaginibacter achroorhodeus TaxID=2599294 RepID=A0A563U5X4_9SPHI|nr:GNAT family protein [Mucilaginibacter achroorhodeus]TWR26735.1 GNAT family N-acetyltransferase [Mucilaginibacter achroorhodeus]